MKKIMFSDAYRLTEAVLSGRKTQTRRICKHDRPDETYDIAFPIFEDKDFDDEGNPISPLYGAFCWRNEAGDCTEWNIPKYKVGEVVAVAQSYKDAGVVFLPEEDEEFGCHNFPAEQTAGWTNKMFVQADLMPHRIRITNVRVERLREIGNNDCFAEGIKSRVHANIRYYGFHDDRGKKYEYVNPKQAYAALIDKISGKGTWESNPYVFVYDFELIK